MSEFNTLKAKVISLAVEREKRHLAALLNKPVPKVVRDWINVPYALKEEAKARGCRWDKQEKRWYVPVGNAAPRFVIEDELGLSRMVK